MTLINLEFTVQRTDNGIEILLPTSGLEIRRGGFLMEVKPVPELLLCRAHLYKKDPYGMARLTTIDADTESTAYFKRYGDDIYSWIEFLPRLDAEWANTHEYLEPVKPRDVEDISLHGGLILGPESLEYWAFRALSSVGVHHPENELFPKKISTLKLEDMPLE